MRFEAVSFSKAGRSKPNEDATLIKELGSNSILLAVADGMGGRPGGGLASNTALEVVSTLVDENPNISIEAIFEGVKNALVIKGEKSEEYGEMGTTLSLVLIQGDSAQVGHVGDCRIYHLRERGIVSRTKDQTEVQRLIDDGILTKQRARDYHRKNILLSVLNATTPYELQRNTFSMEVGDRLVLLSDGAYSLIQKNEIRDISINNGIVSEFLLEIQQTIESRKIRDDYTVVACERIER